MSVTPDTQWPSIAQQDRARKAARQDKLKAEVQAREAFAALPVWKRAKLTAQGKTPPGWRG